MVGSEFGVVELDEAEAVTVVEVEEEVVCRRCCWRLEDLVLASTVITLFLGLGIGKYLGREIFNIEVAETICPRVEFNKFPVNLVAAKNDSSHNT